MEKPFAKTKVSKMMPAKEPKERKDTFAERGPVSRSTADRVASEMPDVAFSKPAPVEGGPFVTASGGKDAIEREPRVRTPES